MRKAFIIDYYLINDILMEWNPLSVEGPALHEEYTSLIPSIVKIKHSKTDLSIFLHNLLEKKYGVEIAEKEISYVVDSINRIN